MIIAGTVLAAAGLLGILATVFWGEFGTRARNESR